MRFRKLWPLFAVLSVSAWSQERQITLTAVAAPNTSGTLNVYRRSGPCKITNMQFKLIASKIVGTTSNDSTTFTYTDYKVYGSNTFCYYVTVSGGSITFPQSSRYQAAF